MKYDALVLYLVLILARAVEVSCWAQWNYTVQWSEDPDKVISLSTQWHSFWDLENYYGDDSPPRPRRGHSLHLIKTDDESDFGGATYVVLFGGRDNNQKAVHIPRTYNVERTSEGNIEFTTYDERPVNPCNDFAGKYYDAAERAGCEINSTASSLIDIGLIYNDVWAYKLCNPVPPNNYTFPERGFDTPCVDSGWVLWHPGALQGGCTIQLGIEVCTVPSERYNHGSVMHDDGTLYVYGGFSQRCTDYCDDIWFFDIYLKGWREVYATGALTNFYTDFFFGETVAIDPAKVPIDNSTSRFAGPSKRWRHSMEIAKMYYDPSDGLPKQQTAIFGGHRLWHGYSPENSQDNNWDVYNTRPIGGYLDDLWIYTKYLDFGVPGLTYRANNGEWIKREPVEQCFDDPGVAWEERFRRSCKTVRPVGRAGHGSAFDWDRQIVWIFGGFTSYYPYLRTDGAGSGPGVTSVGSGGFIPYPGYEYFRNDLWYYNLTSSLWIEVVPEEGYPVPDPRVDAIFLLLGDLIFMHGGFADNYEYDDTWYFNITSLRWLQKKEFVRPIYPDDCTDDFEYINSHNCISLTWPKHLERDEFYPFNIIPYTNQEYYWPDDRYGPYFGILPKDSSESDAITQGTFDTDATAVSGTPLPPFAATGLMQSVRNFTYNYNVSHHAMLFEYCTSTFAEPTRGKVVDGLYGRSNGSVLIAQPRPRKPGWDGCRHRQDGRSDLPDGLQYVQPLPRYSHRAVFHENTSEIIMYGGLAYTSQQPKSLTNTWESSTLSDMWYYNLNHCSNNCTDHGDCYFGFCKCYVGYYGSDCSNISCPGTFCYYDEYTNEQNCTHACQSGYTHTDNDTYVQDIYKLPCTRDDWGESNGICDGYGHVMCAPPFLGDDCGTKDCKSNCSFNGWCSIEYPVSRCMCAPGYFGEICDQKLCLNNCSYPNGECNTTSGNCICNMMYSPYNNTRAYHPWGGEDCSYLFPYAAAGRGAHINWTTMWAIWVCVVLLVAIFSVPVSGSGATVDESVSITEDSAFPVDRDLTNTDRHTNSATFGSWVKI